MSSPTQVEAQIALIAVARAAWALCDNSEDTEGSQHVVDDVDFQRLADALDLLDKLPELPAPYVGEGPAKAEHILGLATLDDPKQDKLPLEGGAT